ncbi:MAG: GNAT family N-acetyltransferase [Patescibacteria group bacterium]
MNISIVEVQMRTIASNMLKQWAGLYCELWKEPPWNEDFWQPESVAEDFRKEMNNTHALAFLAIHEERVVGFTHGYSVSKDELRLISGNDLLDELFVECERIYYVDELGVAINYRGKNIATRLTQALIQGSIKNGISSVTLRTDTQAVAARHVYEKLGFREFEIHDAAHPTRTYWFLQTVK